MCVQGFLQVAFYESLIYHITPPGQGNRKGILRPNGLLFSITTYLQQNSGRNDKLNDFSKMKGRQKNDKQRSGRWSNTNYKINKNKNLK